MMGVFGGYTRWAVVFLIIFVLFFLLCPGYGYGAGVTTGATTVSMTEYDTTTYGYTQKSAYGAYGESESSL